MGLYVHSLSRVPVEMGRDYYVYVLDYGWDEPLGETLHLNFRRMADLAAKSEAIVVAGTDPRAFAAEVLSLHFDDPQFSWSNINGEPGEDILPALMISTIHPRHFLERAPSYRPDVHFRGAADDKLVLIPLRVTCKDASDVAALIERIFRDIAEKKALSNFTVAKSIKADASRSISDAVILKPTLYGIGVDLPQLWKSWKQKRTRQQG